MSASRKNKNVRTRRRVPQAVSALSFAIALAKTPSGRIPLALVVAAVLATTMFLVQAFQTSSQGFDISTLEDRSEELREENGRLSAKSGELRALAGIQKRADELGMIRNGQIVYVDGGETGVAFNR